MFHVNTITMTFRYFLYINMLDANKYFMTNLIRILRYARAGADDVYQSWYIRIGEAYIRVLNPLRRIYRLENFQQDVYSCKAASVFHQWAHSAYLIIVSNCVYLVKSLSPCRVSQKRNYNFPQNYQKLSEPLRLLRYYWYYLH